MNIISFGGILKLKSILQMEGIKKLLEVAPEWNLDISFVRDRFVSRKEYHKECLDPKDIVLICDNLAKAIEISMEELK